MMRNPWYFFLAFFLLGVVRLLPAQTVQVLETRADGSVLLGHSQVAFGAQAAPQNSVSIVVDESSRFQSMDGFGASLTDSSAALLMQMPFAQRQELMQQMFDPSGPLGLTLLRQPIGASDFSAHGDYSYDDSPDNKPDPSLTHFNSATDTQSLFPLLRQALHLNPQLRFLILPWSAPAWMKDSHMMHGGTLINADIPVYAQYLAQTVNTYAAQGLPVFAMALQNEPLNENPGYPTQHMGPEQEVQLAAALRPLLWHDGRNPLLLGYEHNWNNLDYPAKLLSDPAQLSTKDAPALFAGISFHCYAGNESAQLAFLRDHPSAGLWFTECSGTNGTVFANDLLWQAKHLLLGAPLNEARSVLLWNLVLDPHGAPHNGGCGDCRALFTVDNHGGSWTVHRNVEFYELAHAAPFIHPGAVRIAAMSQASHDLQTVAYKNLDGTLVLMVLNEAPRESHVSIQWAGRSASYTAPPRSLMTFTWGTPEAALLEGTYRIATDESAKGLLTGVVGQRALTLTPPADNLDAHQLWSFRRLADGTFEIRNVATAQSLAIGTQGELIALSLDGEHLVRLAVRLQARGICLSTRVPCAVMPGETALAPQASTLLYLSPP